MGWDYEGTEFATRAEKFGTFMRTQERLIHVNHQRTPSSTPGSTFDANRSEMVQFQSMTKRQVENYYSLSLQESEYFSRLSAEVDAEYLALSYELENEQV